MSRICGIVTLWWVCVIALMIGWWILALVCACAISILKAPASLLLLAIFVDSFYGQIASTPVLSLAALGWYISVDWLQSRIMVYDTTIS